MIAVDVHMTVEEKIDSNYFGFGVGDNELYSANTEKIIYTSNNTIPINQ